MLRASMTAPSLPKDARNVLEARIRSLGPWWHQIELDFGLRTRDIAPQEENKEYIDYPQPLWKHIEPIIPQDLTGCSILDIGCSDGFFSLECAKRKAARIVSIDELPNRIRNLTFMVTQLGLTTIEPRVQSIYDLDPKEKFDFVIMLGVLYHLDHPLLGLQKVSAITNKLLLETTVLADEKSSVMHWRQSYSSEIGWNPSVQCLQDMLHAVKFKDLQEIPREGNERVTYLCRK